MIKLVKFFKKSFSTINLKQRFRLTALSKQISNICLLIFFIVLVILSTFIDLFSEDYKYVEET